MPSLKFTQVDLYHINSCHDWRNRLLEPTWPCVSRKVVPSSHTCSFFFKLMSCLKKTAKSSKTAIVVWEIDWGLSGEGYQVKRNRSSVRDERWGVWWQNHGEFPNVRGQHSKRDDGMGKVHHLQTLQLLKVTTCHVTLSLQDDIFVT